MSRCVFGGLAVVASLLGASEGFAQPPPKPKTQAPVPPPPPDPPEPPPAPPAPPAKVNADDPYGPPMRETTAQAQTRLAEAEAARGDCALALRRFEQFEQQQGTGVASEARATCLVQANRIPEAIAVYEKLFAVSVGGPAQRRLSAALTALRSRPPSLQVETAPEGATVHIDGVERGGTPLILPVEAGSHKVRVTAIGFEPAEQEVTLSPGKGMRVFLPLRESSQKPAPYYAYVTGALSIVGLGIGTASGMMALSANADYKSGPTAERIADGEQYSTISTTSFVVAGCLAAITLAVILLPDRSPRPRRPAVGAR